jgi:CHASE2 domain-containing sensor protein
VFDIVFAGEHPDAAGDRRFAEAMARHGNVVLATEFSRSDGGDWVMIGKSGLSSELLRTVAATGLANLPVDPDGVVRRHAARDGLPALAAERARIQTTPP